MHYKRQKKIIPATVGAVLKNYTDADVALKLWWRCNYINYGIPSIFVLAACTAGKGTCSM